MQRWQPPREWRRITTLESHAAGEPLRIVTGGIDPIPGRTMLDKRRYAREHLDGLRRTIVFEPRGHADMYGAIPTEPVTPDGDLGVLFIHNEGWSTMCGHGIIALTTTVKLSDVVVAFAPGAMDAMLALALTLHIDPVFVGAHHLSRFIYVSIVTPGIVHLFGKAQDDIDD